MILISAQRVRISKGCLFFLNRPRKFWTVESSCTCFARFSYRGLICLEWFKRRHYRYFGGNGKLNCFLSNIIITTWEDCIRLRDRIPTCLYVSHRGCLWIWQRVGERKGKRKWMCKGGWEGVVWLFKAVKYFKFTRGEVEGLINYFNCCIVWRNM